MSNPTFRLRITLLRLTVLLSCWLQAYHSVLAADTVVKDIDPSIVYQPPASWHSSSESCATCLNPGTTRSYHEAIHPAVGTTDGDDPPGSQTSNSSRSNGSPDPPSPPSNVVAAVPVAAPPANASPKAVKNSSAAAPLSTPKPPDDDDTGGGDADADGDDDDDDKGGSTASSGGSSSDGSSTSGSNSGSPGSPGKSKRSVLRREVNARLDPDDPGFKDPDVTLSFNFTGSAIYVYGFQPMGVATAATNNTPTNMNLTFTLDGVEVGNWNSTGSSTTPSFTPNQAFLSRSNLVEAPHQLVVHVGQNSTFIFDYLVYTTSSTGNGTSTNSIPSTPLAQNTPSPTVDPKVKKHNIATFAGAVGGSVGVLALFSLGLAISIIRRRRLAARRDQADRESLHTNASDDSPNMSGPAPFVPRFFPDTVIPPDPPTYTAALANNTSTLLASLTTSAYPLSTRSYADIPPSTPPPLEDVPLIPPPPFPMPVSIRLPGMSAGAGPPMLVENPISQNLDSVGTDHSNFTTAPELLPLLQFVESDPVRPQSRASIRSISYDIHGNPLTDPSDEDLR